MGGKRHPKQRKYTVSLDRVQSCVLELVREDLFGALCEASPSFRQLCCAVSMNGTPQAFAKLEEYLQSGSNSQRKASAYLLAVGNSGEGRAILSRAIKSVERATRSAAAYGVSKLKESFALPLWAELQDDCDPQIRELARSRFGEHSRKDYSASAEPANVATPGLITCHHCDALVSASRMERHVSYRCPKNPKIQTRLRRPGKSLSARVDSTIPGWWHGGQ